MEGRLIEGRCPVDGRLDGRLVDGRLDGRLVDGRLDGRLVDGRLDGRLVDGRLDGRLDEGRLIDGDRPDDGRLLELGRLIELLPPPRLAPPRLAPPRLPPPRPRCAKASSPIQTMVRRKQTRQNMIRCIRVILANS